MRRRVLAFLPALLLAGAFATAAGACSSFDDAPEADASSDGGGGSDADPRDANDGGSCTSVGSDFASGKVIPGFVEVKALGGTVEWNQTEGALAAGSLE